MKTIISVILMVEGHGGADAFFFLASDLLPVPCLWAYRWLSNWQLGAGASWGLGASPALPLPHHRTAAGYCSLLSDFWPSWKLDSRSSAPAAAAAARRQATAARQRMPSPPPPIALAISLGPPGVPAARTQDALVSRLFYWILDIG